MVTPEQRRTAVTEAMITAEISERRACRFTGFPRSTQRYQPTRDDRELRARLETLAIVKPRWGYRRLRWLLVREGWPVNRKRVQRVYREAGLTVRKRRRKRVSMARVPRPVPAGPNDRWSMDFAHDTLGDGRVIRIFTVVDDFTRTCPLIAVDLALPATHLTQLLDQVSTTTPLPRAIVCDNGTEFTSQALDQWAHRRGVELHVITPGKPVENCYVESASTAGCGTNASTRAGSSAWLTRAERSSHGGSSTTSLGRTAASPIEPRRSLPRATSPLHLTF